MANDFFVEFGSNASTWAKELEGQLKPARESVDRLNTLLVQLEGRSATVNQALQRHLAGISKEAAEVQSKLGGLGTGEAGVGGGGGEAAFSAAAMIQDLRSYTAQMDQFMGKLGTFMNAIGRAGPEVAKAQTREARAEGQRASSLNQERLRDPATGRMVATGTAGAQSFYQQQTAISSTIVDQLARAMRTSAPAQMTEVPQATINDASFDRIVTAVNRNAKATERVEKAVDKVANRLAKGLRVRGKTAVADDGGDLAEPAQRRGKAVGEANVLSKTERRELAREFRGELKTAKEQGGQEAYDNLWRMLSGQAVAAKARGGALARGGDEEAAAPAGEPRISDKRLRRLRDELIKYETAVQSLDREIEQLSRSVAEGTGDANLLGRKMSELDQATKKRDQAAMSYINQDTRAEASERNRRAAERERARQRAIEIPAVEAERRRERRGVLEMPTDPDYFLSKIGQGEGQLRKADLQSMADIFTQEGYATPYKSVREDTGVTRSTVDELAQSLMASAQQYVASGRATNTDLRAGARVIGESNIGERALNVIGEELRQTGDKFNQQVGRLGISPEAAYRGIALNRLTGGEDPTNQQRGRWRVGSAIGEAEGMLPRENLAEMYRVVEAYQRERQTAGRNDVMRAMRQDPMGFNPYEGDLFRDIEGRGPEAAQARRDLAATQEATARVDEFGREIVRLADDLESAQRQVRHLVRELAKFESIEDPTAKQAEEYTQNLAALETANDKVAQRRQRLEARGAELMDPTGGDYTMFTGAQYREGLSRRDEARMLDEAYRMNAQHQMRQDMENRGVLRSAAFQTVAGARTFATPQGNTRDFYSRMLPGVRQTGRQGRERFEYVDPDQMLGDQAGQRRLRQMNTAFGGFTTNWTRLIEGFERGLPTEQLDQLREKTRNHLSKFLSNYQAAFPEQVIPDERQFLEAQKGFSQDILGDAFAGDKGAMREITRQNRSVGAREEIARLEAEAAAAFNDPKRAEQLQKEIARTLRQRIKALNVDIKELRELKAEAGRTQGSATRDLNRLMGKESVARVRDLTAEVGRLERQQLKDPTTARGDEIRRHRGAIESEYTRTPAIEEARTARDAAVARNEEIKARLANAEQLRGELQAAKKRTTGRIDRSDIEESERALASANRQLARAETRLAEVTARAVEARGRADDMRDEFISRLEPADQERLAQVDREWKDAKKREQLLQGAGDDDAIVAQQMQARADVSRLGAERTRLFNKAGHLPEEAAAYKQTVAEMQRLENAERQAAESVRQLGIDARAAGSGLEQLQQGYAALQERRGDKAEPPAGGGGGGGRGGGGDEGAAAAPGEGGDGILNRILGAINQVNATLKGGLKVNGKLTPSGDITGETAARPERQRQPRSTPQGREDFFANISQSVPALASLADAQDDVATAAALVTQGVLSETRVLDLFRDKLAQTREEATAFAAQVKATVGDTRLNEAATAAEDQAQREESQRMERLQTEGLRMNEEFDRQAKRAGEQEAVDQRAARSAARSAQEQAAAMELLSNATKEHIAELERLVRAGAKAEQVSEQMTRTYQAVAGDMRGAGAQQEPIKQAARNIFEGAGVQTDAGEMNELSRAARAANGFRAVDSAMAEGVIPGGLFGEQSLFTQAMFGNSGFWSRIMASTGTFIVRNFAAGFVFGMTAALQDVITQAIQTEATFIRVSHALEATGRDAQSLRGDLQAISVDTGTALNDVYMTAAGLTGLFETPEEIAGATEVVAQLQQISGGALNAQEAMGALASIQGAFSTELEGGVEGLTHIADVLTVVQNNIGTNVEVTAEAVGRMSGLAAQLGISYEEVAVYGAQIAKLTNQTGAAAGEQFSRILGAMQTGRARSAIEEAFGEVDGRETQIGTFLSAGDYSQTLRIMSAEWDNLSKAQQSNVAIAVAGQRQAAAFAALMNNGTKSLESITRAENAHGEAAERMNALMNTLNKQIDVLGTNFQNLASNLVRTGLLNFLGLLLKATNLTLEALNDMLTTLNDMADAIPVLDFLRDVGFGLLGMVAAVVLVTRSIQGLKATLAAMPAMGAFMDGMQGGGRPGASPVSRPAMSTFGAGPEARAGGRFFGHVGAGAFASRSTGFLLDRTLGRPLESTGRGLTSLSQRLSTSAATIQEEGRARSAFTRRWLGAGAGALGAGVGGFATGARETFQGRGGAYFGETLPPRLRERAAMLREPVAGSHRLGGASTAMRTQAMAQRTLARGFDLSARASTRLGSTLGALANSGLMADAALGALVVGLSLWISEINEANQIEQSNREWIESRFGKGKGKTEEEEEREAYVGPQMDRFRERSEKFEAGGLAAGVEGLKAILGETLRGGFLKALPTGGRNYREAIESEMGLETVDGERQTAGLDTAQKVFRQNLKGLREVASAPGATADAVQGELELIEQRLAEEVSKIEEDENLSENQKEAALANIEWAGKLLSDQATNLGAVAEGLRNATALASDEITNIQTLIQTASALGGRTQVGGVDLTPVLGEMFKGTNLDLDTALGQDIDEIASGGLDAVEIAVRNERFLADAVTSMQQRWLSKLRTDPEAAAEMFPQLQALINELATAGDNTVQAIVDDANAAADAATQGGDYAGAQQAYNQALRRLERRRLKDVQAYTAVNPTPVAVPEPQLFGDLFGPKLTTRDKKRDQQNQAIANEIFNKRVEAKIAEATAAIDLQIAGATGEGERSALEQQRAGIVLQEYRKANRNDQGLKVDADKMKQAKIQWITSSQSAAQSAMSLQVAQMAAQAAGMWNDAEAAAMQEKIAIQEYHDAVKRSGGRNTVEAQQALAGRRAARKSRKQAYDAEAQAARDASLAAIPQGNATAVASQGVANAQAALAEARKYGTTSTQYQGALAQLYQAQQQATQAQGAVAQAQAQMAVAYADARGDTVASAQAAVGVAQAALSAALANSGGANSAEVLQAQAQLISANAGVSQAQAELVQQRWNVSIALAEAEGRSVRASTLRLGAAKEALQAALRRSGGERTSEVLQAEQQVISMNAALDQSRVELAQSRMNVSIAIAEAAGRSVRASKLRLEAAQKATKAALEKSGGVKTPEVNAAREAEINAEAAARDAVLQDRLDTINFNLEMGRTTQSAAISALREILRTQDLTKQQRRDLLLRIKGMKDEMAESQWNIGDIKMPTPYQMRRYIATRKAAREREEENARRKMNEAVGARNDANVRRQLAPSGEGGGQLAARTTQTTNETTIYIDGADTAKVERIIDKYVGKATRVRTTQARRR